MAGKAVWVRRALSAAGTLLAAVALAGCVELDMKEAVEVEGSVLSGEFSYTLVISEEFMELDPEGEIGLDECPLPSAGDPLPTDADLETRMLAEAAKLLSLRRTHDSWVGNTLRCAWSFRVDLAEWAPVPGSPLLADVKYTEAPRRGWWVHQVPAGEMLGEELPEEMIEELLGGVRMTSTVSGEGVIAEGYVHQDDGSWRWSGSLSEVLQARPRYWIPG